MIKFAAAVEYLNPDANEIITSTDTASFKEQVAALKNNEAVTRITILSTVAEHTRQTSWNIEIPKAAKPTPAELHDIFVEIFKL